MGPWHKLRPDPCDQVSDIVPGGGPVHSEEGHQIPSVCTAVPLSFPGTQALLEEGGTVQAADSMESLSAPIRRGPVTWQGLLLAGKEGTIPGGGLKEERLGLAGASCGGQHSESGGDRSVWT